jgi:hypothetical protein
MTNDMAPRWLIANLKDGKMVALTLNGGGGRVLPVFSFRDEAEMYVRLQLTAPGWEPREFSADEIASMLYRSLSDVSRVALDPLPEVCDKTVLDLLCVGRETFVRTLTGVERGEDPAEAARGRPAEASLRKSGSTGSRAAVIAANE